MKTTFSKTQMMCCDPGVYQLNIIFIIDIIQTLDDPEQGMISLDLPWALNDPYGLQLSIILLDN